MLPLTLPRGIRLAHYKEPAASRGIERLKNIEKVQIPLTYGGMPASAGRPWGPMKR